MGRHSPNKIRVSGFFAGFTNGVSGGGYGAISATGLISAGVNPHVAVGSTLLSEAAVAVSGVLLYFYLLGDLNWGIILALLIGGAIATPIGVLTTKSSPSRKLGVVIGVIVMSLGVSSAFVRSEALVLGLVSVALVLIIYHFKMVGYLRLHVAMGGVNLGIGAFIISLARARIDEKRNKLHSFFRFPGSFHPPLVNMILKKHETARLIGDPMAGSGCVAVEAIAEGRGVVSMDIDPLSCLITRVKSDPMEPEEYERLILQWLELTCPLPTVNQSEETDAKDLLQQLETTDYSWPPNIFHWFEPYVVASLAKLLIALSDFGLCDKSQNFLEATLASIIRRVSRADPQPVSGLEVTKIMKKRLEKGIIFDVAAELRERSEMLAEGCQHLLSLDSLGTSRVILGDVRSDWYEYCHKYNFEPELVITSPPYCNAIEYWRRHRLEYFWLGLLSRDEILEKSRKFLGSTTLLQEDLRNLNEPKLKDVCFIIERIEAKGRIRKARLLKKYFLDMEKWISSVLSTLSSNGIAYIVVGPSTSHGVFINTPKFVADIIHLEGYNAKTLLKYSLKNQRMQFPTRNDAKVKTETVIAVSK